jgi:hypothetical protein
MPTFDWMHVLALAAGALATALYTRTASPSSAATPSTATPKPTTAAATASTSITGNPLFDALLKVLEGKLSDLIAVEPGPDGSPMVTVRVVLAPEAAMTPAAASTSTPAAK